MSTAAARVGDSTNPSSQGSSTLRVTSSLDVLAEVRAFVRARLASLGADERCTAALVQCVDEWVTNVVVHGYGDTPGPVSVVVRREDADIVVVVDDLAAGFDPATVPPFDPTVPLERRPLGGMGMALIRDLCATFEHRALPRTGNEVTMRRPALTGGTR